MFDLFCVGLQIGFTEAKIYDPSKLKIILHEIFNYVMKLSSALCNACD